MNVKQLQNSDIVKSNVWLKRGKDEISRRAFFGILGLVLSYGFFLTYIIGSYTSELRLEKWMFWTFGLIIPIIGVIIAEISNKPLFSFIGFNLLVVGISIILGPVLYRYDSYYQGIVVEAVAITALITFAMFIIGVSFPKFFEKIEKVLFLLLTFYVLVGIGALFFKGLQNITDTLLWIYLGIGIFTFYIGYDMHRATKIPATLDNAIDVAVALYLDIINLLLKILRAMAKSKQRR